MLVNAMNKLDTSYNEENRKIVEEAEKKTNDSVADRERLQPKLCDSSMDFEDMTLMSEDIKRPCDR